MRRAKSAALYAVIAVSTLAVLALDVHTPLGYAVGVGYVLPLLAAFGVRDKKNIFVFAAFCSVLIAAAFFIKPPGAHPSIALFNRFLSLGILWVTSILLYYRKLSLEKLRASREALKESEAKFRGLAEEALVGIYLVQDRRFLYVNPRFAGMLGRSAPEITGMKDMAWIVAPDQREFFEEVIHTAYSGESRSASYEVRMLKKDGEAVEVEGVCTNTLYNGRPALVGTALDVTKRKLMERQKADFYAMVTHDLKSPLTAIMGYAELIASDGSAGDGVREMAASILKGSDRLGRLVDDFLTHSRLESGMMRMDFGRTDAAVLLAEVREAFAGQAARCGLTLAVDAEDGLPPLPADRAHLARALSNLVQNAVNYTPEGGCVTLVAGRRTEGDGDYIALSVADTGPGISPDEQGRVFEKYYRSPRTAGIKGTGLGLAIVKAVAEAHGGRVELTSEVGKGSTFSVVLPAEDNKKGLGVRG